MIKKKRKIIDSKTKNKSGLAKQLTRIQYETIESLLNASLNGCMVFDPRNGCFYKKKMIPCTLNDLKRAIGKKVDKLFNKLSNLDRPIIKKVIDCRGRDVWMINPDLYWDYLGWELYYNRWLFEVGDHKLASQIVNLSLHYGYYYSTEDCKPLRKIPRSHWVKMCKWWLLIDNESSVNLLNFKDYQPQTSLA